MPELQYGDDNSQSLYCSQCNVSFKHRKYLMAHIRKKHPQKIKCKNCDEVFDVKFKLETHMNEKHELEGYKCDKCDKEFVFQMVT